jgi:hypothetical protein
MAHRLISPMRVEQIPIARGVVSEQPEIGPVQLRPPQLLVTRILEIGRAVRDYQEQRRIARAQIATIDAGIEALNEQLAELLGDDI